MTTGFGDVPRNFAVRFFSGGPLEQPCHWSGGFQCGWWIPEVRVRKCLVNGIHKSQWIHEWNDTWMILFVNVCQWDPCAMAVDSWARVPFAHSSLSRVLLCLEFRMRKWSLIQGLSSTEWVVSVIDCFLFQPSFWELGSPLFIVHHCTTWWIIISRSPPWYQDIPDDSHLVKTQTNTSGKKKLNGATRHP